MSCESLFKNRFRCSLAEDFEHEVHMNFDERGHIVARWHTVTEELDVKGIFPTTVTTELV